MVGAHPQTTRLREVAGQQRSVHVTSFCVVVCHTDLDNASSIPHSLLIHAYFNIHKINLVRVVVFVIFQYYKGEIL